jgi:hypothetical protein
MRSIAIPGLCAVLLATLSCTALRTTSEESAAAKATPAAESWSAAEPVKVKTVPPPTPLPLDAQGNPIAPPTLPARGVRNEGTDKALKENKLVGPEVTFAGIVRADGKPIEKESVTKSGIPVYSNFVGSGFMVVIEAKPGFSQLEVGKSIFRYEPDDPTARPDLEIQVDRALGDGSKDVCDARPPKFGGIPAIKPANFSETPEISAAINDFSCRFEVFGESEYSCTVNNAGEFHFLNDKSEVQFCMVVARKWNFPDGDTTVSVRLRDSDGNPGPVSKFILRKTDRPTPTPRTQIPSTPTPVRRRP